MMDSEYLAKLRSRLEAGFSAEGDRATSVAPGFSWHQSFFDRSVHDQFSAILVFAPHDSLDELVSFEVSATKALVPKWTMDLVGTSLLVEDLRWRSDDRQAGMTGDPDVAADAVLDFLSRVRPVIVQELSDWADRNALSR